jgi:predicted metal-dependent phosphoesterase TrpH
VSTSIDLHLHTTASDGRCTPTELVRRVHAAGIRVMSVTDHDTRAGEAEARAAADGVGIELISGIEVTSVHRGRDVHVLGYGLPAEAPALDAVIRNQRQQRVERAREIGERLGRLGVPIDIEKLVAAAAAASGKALARPQIAQALVEAGHVASITEAFDRYLDDSGPAYVPHRGIGPAEVVALLAGCGGVASLAHPGRVRDVDSIIGDLVDAGLGCIEAYHSSHDEAAQSHFLDVARRFELGVTGGSDFHGDGTRLAECFGVVGLPEDAFASFRALLDEARLTPSAT